MRSRPLYIETKIKCDIEDIWKRTQNPELHEKWDLRFSQIKYLPKESQGSPQQFLYETRIGFGLRVNGLGESVISIEKENGIRISSLKFWSEKTVSIIKEGGGFWKYVPEQDGIRFFTKYDYQTRWGIVGAIVDKFFFRPLLVWATAWSFDCLKNWLEKEISPAAAFSSLRICLVVNLVLGLVWIYHGIVPKFLYPNSGELDLLHNAGVSSGHDQTLLAVIGLLEIAFGLLFLFPPQRWIYWLNIIALVILGLGVLMTSPAIFGAPFNPFTLNLSLIALSVIGLIACKWLPKASNCLTREPQ